MTRNRLRQSTSLIGLWHALERGNSITRTQDFADEMAERLDAGEKLAKGQMSLVRRQLHFN